MAQEVLVWDNATGCALLEWRTADREQHHAERYEKRRFLTDFPRFLENIADSFALSPDAAVYVGAGPGSFTGIKTGIALIGAFFYARGVTTIRLVSSLDLLSLRAPLTTGGDHIVLHPFNAAACFVTAFHWDGAVRRTLTDTCLMTAAQIHALCNAYAAGTVLIADRTLPPAIEAAIAPLIPEDRRRYPEGDIALELLPTLSPLAVIDLRRDPLLLNYLALPADLPGGPAAYYVPMN